MAGIPQPVRRSQSTGIYLWDWVYRSGEHGSVAPRFTVVSRPTTSVAEMGCRGRQPKRLRASERGTVRDDGAAHPCGAGSLPGAAERPKTACLAAFENDRLPNGYQVRCSALPENRAGGMIGTCDLRVMRRALLGQATSE